MKERLLRILLVAGCMYATACALDKEPVVYGPEAEGEEVVVTFLLSAETQVGTRGDEEGEGEGEGTSNAKQCTISDGHLINKVVYAVYVKEYDNDANGNPTWNGNFRLLDQYGDGTEGLGEGQALLDNPENMRTENGATLTLRLMRGQEYVIGFWAQNEDCTAYDSTNLEEVVVDYKAQDGKLAPNNDEIRDAFCQVYTFTATIGVTEHVVLKRAMAQINVGTAGWDYNDEVKYGNSYAYSKIVMKGLKNKLNVLTGEATTDNFDGEVTYDWAPLPAYIDKVTGKTKPYTNENNSAEFAEWLKNKENNDQFLYVKLLNSSDYLPYLETEPEDPNGIATEVFKYLSMCYVLAPAINATTAPSESVQDSGLAITLTFYLAEGINENGEGYVYMDEEKEDPTTDNKFIERFTLDNVPVQRNWRTNILGGLRGGEDDSLFDPRAISLWVDIDPGYDGDHFRYDHGNGTVDDWKDNSKYPKEDNQEPEEEEEDELD